MSDFSYMREPERLYAIQLKQKMLELLPTDEWQWSDSSLWLAASSALGNDDERYSNFYVCLNCEQLYHGEYSANSDPERDFCGFECEVDFRQRDHNTEPPPPF